MQGMPTTVDALMYGAPDLLSAEYCLWEHRSLSPSPPPRSARCEAAGQLRPSEQSTAEQEYLEGPSTATTSPKGASSLARCAKRARHELRAAGQRHGL